MILELLLHFENFDYEGIVEEGEGAAEDAAGFVEVNFLGWHFVCSVRKQGKGGRCDEGNLLR